MPFFKSVCIEITFNLLPGISGALPQTWLRIIIHPLKHHNTLFFATMIYIHFPCLMIKYKVDDTSDEEDDEVFVNRNTNKYDDYYRFIASSKSIRPICVTEDVDFENMPFIRKIIWWFGTIFKVKSVFYVIQTLIFNSRSVLLLLLVLTTSLSYILS